ncbi:unnamed protein product [Caenorhabditis angaria]|uniref:Protein kinase domain-containing protein n=1 Tax=Caenorhabditis angaria TaxID=860376 RepID=A0A9P1MWT2_9PELO|nr:unnamed protein product [Caenorhabditis angaria]
MTELKANQITDNGQIIKEVRISFTGHRLCGSGRFSNVYNCKLITPYQKEVAIKNVWSDTIQKSAEEYVEIQILSTLYHPALANLLFYYSQKVEERNIHCLVLEFMPQEMSKLREKGVKFDVLDAKIYTFQLFCAVAYLDLMKIAHLDIKPQNIILNVELGLLKLADFGNARRLNTSEKMGVSYQVTRFYRPPELLFGSNQFSSAIDVWSAGCVSFEFFANHTLFKGKDTVDQMNLVITVLGYPTDEDVRSMGVKRPRVAKKVARGLEQYTSNCLEGVVYDYLKSIIIIDPKKRKTASQILKLPIFDVIQMRPREIRNSGKPIPELEHLLKMDYRREDSSSEESSDK